MPSEKPDLKVSTGSPLPLGVSKTESGHNFAVFSSNATTVKLGICFSRDTGPAIEITFDPQTNKTGDIWHLRAEGLPNRFFYLYTMDGDWKPASGLTFNPKLGLIDPYAKMISGFETWNSEKDRPLPMAYHEDWDYDWEGDRPLNRTMQSTIIYELHVRGFTKHGSSNVDFPGTFRGITEKIDHLKELGITAVELMPIHEFDETDCRYRNPKTGKPLLDFWGYSSINFFSVKSSYASESFGKAAKTEFCDMVKTLHRNGIEVILDVVFNHTAEGGWDRKVINFKGLDNGIYYILDEQGDYRNYSGCGNTMNCNHPVVMKMIIDSLRYFVVDLHVDGFRFDLASIFSRNEKGEVMDTPPLIDMIAKDPVLSETKLIAEAWDASGLYQVGKFSADDRWAEWNDKFRDTMRGFCRGDASMTADLATRICGSDDLYKTSGRKPIHSVNFITTHDGFTMMDLVSYEQKNNWENGQENRDGKNENVSMNFGVEGDTSNDTIIAKRNKQIRNFATLLMLSQGTPMILAGDEFGNTQSGNNNAWCQDNSVSWLDWNLCYKNASLLRFWQKIITFRKNHLVFQRDNFFSGEINPTSMIADISWHNEKPHQPLFESSSSTLAFLIDGMEGSTRVDETFYVALNFDKKPVRLELPVLKGHYHWREVLSTSSPDNFINDRTVLLNAEQTYVECEDYSIKILSATPRLGDNHE